MSKKSNVLETFAGIIIIFVFVFIIGAFLFGIIKMGLDFKKADNFCKELGFDAGEYITDNKVNCYDYSIGEYIETENGWESKPINKYAFEVKNDN